MTETNENPANPAPEEGTGGNEPRSDNGPIDEAGVKKLRAEAANWRTKVRDLEAETAAKTSALETAQRQLVDMHNSAKLADTADFWHGDRTVTDFVSEDGTLDLEAVNAAVSALLDASPHFAAKPAAATLPGNANRPAGASDRPPLRSWAEALKPSGVE